MPRKRGPQFELGIIAPCRPQDIDPKRPKSKQRVCLFSKSRPRKLLGRHPTYKKALRQERVIQIRKRG
jgi:hypothetical protein